MLTDSPHNPLTREIIGAAIEVHRVLGPGLLESAYLRALQFELASRNLRFVRQTVIPMAYKGTNLGTSYRVDLIVEDRIVVEVKAVEKVLPVHKAQVLTYLRLTACPFGLLINFNVAKLIDGVYRLVNPLLSKGNQPEDAGPAEEPKTAEG
ncbi:MAG TPA: GxxExxY protein [Vicinamibacterales bacterium]|nr:GxxExxY protein [Vicinamibacterales bacterium]